MAPSKQVNSGEKLQLQECLWAGEWGLEHLEHITTLEMLVPGGMGGGEQQQNVDQSGLSLLSESLGSFKDDMLLVETRGPHDNRSLCALEPSGCTPLPSRASTVRAREPS
jgi:hypothetical protein